MALLANAIRFGEPRAELGVDLSDGMHAKRVEVVPRRKRLDLSEARTLQAARQDNVAVQPFLARRHLCKRHAYLKRDARLLGQDAHRSNPAYRREYSLEERPNPRVLTPKMGGERMPSAGVCLMAVGKGALALWTAPEHGTVFHSL